MILKFSLILLFSSIILISTLTIVSGEVDPHSSSMEPNPSKDFSDLLKDENPRKFYSNQKSGDFQANFVKKATLTPSNSITIKSGTTITLSGPLDPDRGYSTILVEGNLKITDTGNSALRVQKIIVSPSGSLQIGTQGNPINNDKKVEIIFVKSIESELGIFVFGKLFVHGKTIEHTFVDLKNYAKKSDKRLIVNTELYDWEQDDVVVVTSLGNNKCNEIASISKITKQVIVLQTPLTCSHRVTDDPETNLQSHVALLSRNVIISSEDVSERGSVNFFHGSTGYIKYAQFDKLGPKEVLGRYPIHFHHLKDTSRGIEVIGNSITNSANRWITIHDSNGIIVKKNVGYISQGHGFFLEDGNEFDNVFEKNIGIITKKELILPHSGSSVFWTQNPMNVYRNNVAVNAPYWGFSFEIPKKNVDLPNSDKQINLRSLPSLEFEGNIAYNNRHGRMGVSRPVIEDKAIESSDILISNFPAMGSQIEIERHFGILVVCSNTTISNSYLLNNRFGIQLSGQNNKIIDTKIEMERISLPEMDISGIVVAGRNNLIEHSKINGYVSKNDNNGYDISLLNDKRFKNLISAKVVNTTLLDPRPLYIGNPTNENSFLEIYGYDAPFAKIEKIPENFLLKKIGT